MMEVLVTVGAIKRAELQWNRHQRTNTKLFGFGSPDALPVAQSRVSEHWRSHFTLTSSSPGAFQPCLWPPETPGYLKDGCQDSCQPSDPI